MKKIIIIIVAFTSKSLFSQVISGPMVGHTELRTSNIWMQFSNDVKVATLFFYKNGATTINSSSFDIANGLFKTAHALMYNLEPGNTYQYRVVADKKKDTIAFGTVTTQTLWQWRDKIVALPEFSFLTGSCTYMNQPEFDRLGKPYGNDSSIFETMAKEKADFMLWLGDNWYTREVDYYSDWGLHARPSRERAMPIYKNFLKSMANYAIWDDHDYGWNDADKSFPLKQSSLQVFKQFWSNPSYGENGEGIYTKFTWNDIDVFLLDDRWFRSNDNILDSINGKVNINKRMFGEKQMEWLKNALVHSNSNTNINFRIIATGSQILNPMSPYDCFRHFSTEYKEMMDFINENEINGLVFLTGDRHHSEVIKINRTNNYPLYDITASPLTSGSHKFGGEEKNNPYRVVGVEDMQNYSKISFTGDRKNRVMKVEFFNPKGIKQTEWITSSKELRKSK